MHQRVENQNRQLILAGDVGGTKTRLALFSISKKATRLLREKVFPSQRYPSLEAILEEFLGRSPQLGAVGVGVPGPIIGGMVKATNLPWAVHLQSLERTCGIREVGLINDLVAHAYGLLALKKNDLETIHPGRKKEGTIALIAPETGLGAAILFWDGQRHLPSPSEGGHVDFAPRTPLEIDLFRYLGRQFGHVSYERISSGTGLGHIYRFLRDSRRFGREPAWLARKMENEDPAAVITTMARQQKNQLCSKALDMFTSIFGAAAGNLALTAMALGGVYLGGGIPPKIIWKLKEGTFLRAFQDKGRLTDFVGQIPVQVIMNDRAALLGAASYAKGLLKATSEE